MLDESSSAPITASAASMSRHTVTSVENCIAGLAINVFGWLAQADSSDPTATAISNRKWFQRR
jgi:hypothetical protein